jgi:hypothetical protein
VTAGSAIRPGGTGSAPALARLLELVGVEEPDDDARTVGVSVVLPEHVTPDGRSSRQRRCVQRITDRPSTSVEEVRVSDDHRPSVGPRGAEDAEVLVVAPTLNSWLRHWLSDDYTARRRAEKRVTAHLERLERSGVHAEGRVGDADPLLAIADALPTFPADEIVIAAGRCSTRLAEGLTTRARELFALPTSHTAEPLPCAA